MTLTRIVAIMLLVSAATPVLAQGTGQTTQGATRYSIDGPGGGVPTSRPPATQPVPPATSVYPYARQSRSAPLTGRQTNVPLRAR